MVACFHVAAFHWRIIWLWTRCF